MLQAAVLRAPHSATQEVIYLRSILSGLQFPPHGPTEVWEDNAACISMSENPVNRDRSGHIDTMFHFLREHVRAGRIKLMKCAGPRNVADALTKSLPRPAFVQHREFMWGTRTPFSAFYCRSFSAFTSVAATGKPPVSVPVGSVVRLVRTSGG